METVNGCLSDRLDEMEAAIRKTSFRKGTGRANEKKHFLEKCYDFEKKNGMERITKAVTNAMKINDNDSLIVQYIKEHTPENAIVFLTGIGKCYPILRSHKVLNNLHQAFVRCPVVMFFPGTYNEQELILFNEIKDDNYYRAFRLVK